MRARRLPPWTPGPPAVPPSVEVAPTGDTPAAELAAAAAERRSFRNRLIRLLVISVVTLGALLVGFARTAVPLQVEGESAPSYLQIGLLVSPFGAIGALIIAVPPLAQQQGTWNRSHCPTTRCC